MAKKMTYTELLAVNKKLQDQNLEMDGRIKDLLKFNQLLESQNNERANQLSELTVLNQILSAEMKSLERRSKRMSLVMDGLKHRQERDEFAARDLKNLNRQLLHFTDLASQELQEPLRKIEVFTEKIFRTESASLQLESQKLLSRVRTSTGRMQHLIKDLITYSRTSAAGNKFIPTDLNTIVNEVSKELQDLINSKKAMIMAPGLGFATIDPLQFRQVFFNLISNALKFSHPDLSPKIVISKSRLKDAKAQQLKIGGENKYIRISVKDNGIGFNSAHKEKIFEPFQRLHGNEEYPGTGVGLTIVRKIVENHRGVIIAESKEGAGSDFQIIIPIDPMVSTAT